MQTIPQRLLGEALLNSARNHPTKTAIIVKGESYSYIHLKTKAENLAHHLIKSGVKKGDRVAIYLENSWSSVVSIYGITLAGAVFLVINPQTKSDKLKFILNDSSAKILITTALLKKEFLTAAEETPGLLEIIITGDPAMMNSALKHRVVDFENATSKIISGIVMPNVIPNDLAALIYTSGSTGFPKGVMMTHQSMVFASWSLIQYLRLTEHDRIMLLLPLAFDYGLYQLLMAITTGGTLIIEQSFIFITSILENMQKHKPTVFPGVPTIYAMLIAYAKNNNTSFDYIEKVTNTAAALPAEFTPDLKNIFPNALIFRMYGLTECKRVCYLEPELIDIKPESVGKAIPGTEVFLLSPGGEPVAPGEPGILHIRGPHVMLGYLNREDLSNEMLKPGKLPGERILCSNDWFKMDEEGFLYFLGRNDDIIKTRGEKVSPIEIENVIYAIDGVREAVVFGTPDKVMGESIVAFVTLKDGSTLNEKIIHRTCMAHLESFMVPGKIILIHEMPKSSNGKIDKKELKKQFLNDSHES
ncbi:MAG: AMP-binding protein [Chitinophagaceae bacterium]|jgi:acyl-CoA synthetase (AMP-forming)/AMP-acid ligase II|nr:AMP-binding protein [Chitinophagaceae bacterium]OQY93788.1 MAG: long chain acyl-CoA synthetase [Sphingobacteriales bacterium UTBCD1]